MTNRVIDHIREIIAAADEQITVVDVREEDITADHAKGLVLLPIATTSSITSDKQKRNMEVDMFLLEAKGMISFKGNDELARKMKVRQDELKDVLEKIWCYLTLGSFKYPYLALSDIELIEIDDFTIYELFGAQAIFTVEAKYRPRSCCVKFDESKLK